MSQLKQKGYQIITKYFGKDAAETLLAVPATSETSGKWKITSNDIMKMVIGSPINSANSTFQTSPIFNIPLLNDNQKLDTNTDSNAKAETSMGLFSNKEASTDSSMFGLDIEASSKTSFWGAGVEASAGYSQKNSEQKSVSSGETYLSMIYEIYDSYVDMLVTHGEEAEDFSAYLVGTKLSDEELKKYVDYNSEEKKLIINDGYLPDPGNVLGNVQLLGRMEDIFGTMKTECANDPKLLEPMLTLKNNISKAIKIFYSRYGNLFASRLWLAAYAVGGGNLSYENTSGNSQNQYSETVSLEYSSLISSGSMSEEVSYAKQHGYSSAMKSINVTAFAIPANTVDTNAWALSIQKMLQEEGKALEVPPAGSFEMPKFIIPSAPEKKNPLDPPSSCFKSYDDWKQYLADKKADEAKVQNNKNVEKAQDDFDEFGLVRLFDQEDDNALIADEYQLFRKELESIASKKDGAEVKASIQSLRVDNRIVVGFDSTPYNKVLPQLRPDLSIPDESVDFSEFPNMSKLLVTNTNLSKLGIYINFMNNFYVPGLRSVELATEFESFLKSFLKESNELISSSLQVGKDVPTTLMQSMIVYFFGSDSDYQDSKLFKDMDESYQKYKYVMYLLRPNVQRIWAEAPGGYVNTMWVKKEKDTGHTYAIPQYVGSMGSVDRKRDICECAQLVWDNPDVNPLSLFHQTVQTPLYPIFVYTATGDPKLYFLQMIKNMQSVFTAENVQFSGPKDYQSVAFLKDTLIEPKEILDRNENIKNYRKQFKFDDNQAGFSLEEENHTWDYGLNFSFLNVDKESTDRNQVLILTNFNKSTFLNGYSCCNDYLDPKSGLGKLSNIKKPNNKFSFSDQDPCLILRPIKSGTYDTDGFNSQAFSMYSNYGPKQIVKCSSLDNAVDLSVFKEANK